VATADGAVVHLYFNSGWDDCCSSKAIWTCRMGREGRETGKKEFRTTRNGCVSPESLSLQRGGGVMQRAAGS